MSKPEYVILNGNPKSHYTKVSLTYRLAKALEMLCNRYNENDMADEFKIEKRTAEGYVETLYNLCGIETLPGKKQREHKQLVEWAIRNGLVRLDNKVYYLSDYHHVSQLLQPELPFTYL